MALVEPLKGGWLYRVEPDTPPLPHVETFLKPFLKMFARLLRRHTAVLSRRQRKRLVEKGKAMLRDKAKTSPASSPSRSSSPSR